MLAPGVTSKLSFMSESAATPPDPEPDKAGRGQRALEWLNKHWLGPRNCPICERQNWTILDLVDMRVFSGPKIILGPVYVMVPVMCTTCKYTWQFNAIEAGVLEPSAIKAGPDPTADQSTRGPQ